MSITTTSGLCSSARATASRPFLASATTVHPFWAVSSCFTPRLTMSWSSATRIFTRSSSIERSNHEEHTLFAVFLQSSGRTFRASGTRYVLSITQHRHDKPGRSCTAEHLHFHPALQLNNPQVLQLQPDLSCYEIFTLTFRCNFFTHF